MVDEMVNFERWLVGIVVRGGGRREMLIERR